MENKLNIAYGLYLENNKRFIYDIILSIKSIQKYNKINNITIFTNKINQVKDILEKYLQMDNIIIYPDTTLVDSIYDICGNEGAHKYLTKGIFYRIQALCTLRNFLYLDTDVICSGKLKLPKYNRTKDIIKNNNDSSCIMYSYNGIDEKDLLYYMQYNKKHISTLEFPDECIIHDGFGFMERKFNFKNLTHFGNTDYFEHNNFNYQLWKVLLKYIDTNDKINPLYFNSYFRSPRYTFMHKGVNE